MDRLILSMFISIISVSVIGINSGDVASQSNRTLNVKALFDLGTRYNKPFLRLIGKSLINLECQNSPCSGWSEWSACKLFVGQYGAKSRTRTCGGTAANGCQTEGEPTTESESVICQEFCPSNYEMVHDKFCLRLYNGSKQDKKNAESSCASDGGYLININSPKKWAAFLLFIEKYKTISYVYIDGHRENKKAPWRFSYETYITEYTNWASGDPDNASSDLCLVAIKNSSAVWRIYDDACSATRFYVCESIPQ